MTSPAPCPTTEHPATGIREVDAAAPSYSVVTAAHDARARMVRACGALVHLRRERAAARHALARGDAHGPDYGDTALVEYGDMLATIADLRVAVMTAYGDHPAHTLDRNGYPL